MLFPKPDYTCPAAGAATPPREARYTAAMIPLHGLVPSRTRPIAVLAIAAVQAVAWLVAWPGVQFAAPSGWASVGVFVPVGLSLIAAPAAPALVANVMVLWLFGAAVEDRLGHVRFVALWLAAGIAATAAQVAAAPSPAAAGPLLGATGAAAGVIAALLALYPRGRILAASPVVIGIELVDLPAWLCALVWLSVIAVATLTSAPAVVAAAVLAGLAAGASGARLLRRRERMTVEWWGD